MLTRRRLVQAPLAAAALAAVPRLGAQAGQPRLALLVGNREYPSPHDLPSIHKNVRDVGAALQRRGFEVAAHTDLDAQQVRQALDEFSRRVAAAGPDTVAWFYFSGHGTQLDAENLLVGARTNPDAQADQVQKASAQLGADVVQRLRARPRGLTVAVIDACRTNLRGAATGQGGLNQVEAPPGYLIAFCTGAGRPALAPVNENQNTFYTAELVKHLDSAPDALSFSDLFRLVRLDTRNAMLKHPAEIVRRFAQNPFIAENTSLPTLLSRHVDNLDALLAQGSPSAGPGAATTAQAAAALTPAARDWAALQATAWAPDIVRLAEQFMAAYPEHPLFGAARIAAEGAQEAASILRRNDIRLYRRNFDLAAVPDEPTRAELLKAARGDKDAAARLGRAYRTGASSGPEVSRYEGWMQYAAELGNGIASYELARHYRRVDQPQPAARWEERAKELGYTPPAALDNRRK